MKELSASNRKVVSPGEKTLNWLYEEQLRVDPEWSVRFFGGFTWWADQHAQTVEIVASEKDEDGATADLISVSMLRPVQKPRLQLRPPLRLSGNDSRWQPKKAKPEPI
jgi:hypothetical protein